MNLKAHFGKEHSKANCLETVNWIGNNPERFRLLMEIFSGNDHRLTQRAAWPLSLIAVAHPEWLKPYYSQLISKMSESTVHPGVRRNTLRLFAHTHIPEEWEGILMDLCFQYINTHKEPVAIKGFSLYILEKMAKKHPAILPEIILIIDEQMPHETAAFQVRAKKILSMR